MITLLAIDMDGTCLNDKKLMDEETLAMLRLAAQKGITVVPTTGRSLSCLPHQLKEESFYPYVISSNGAAVTDMRENRDIYTAAIASAEAAAFLRLFADRKIGISAHIRHEFVVQGHGLRLLGKLSYGRDAASTQYARDIAADLEKSGSDVEEIQLFFFTEETRQLTRQLVEENSRYLAAYSENYVELYAQNASKGAALAALAAHLGVAREQIACIGDAENDLSMFEASGLPFAMGNAIPALKERAAAVLPSNNENGVAAAIRHILSLQK